MRRRVEMRIGLLSVAAWLFTLLCPSHEVQVMQPENRTLNPDGTVSITCSHIDTDQPITDELLVIDARLNRLNNAGVAMVCQVNNSHIADCTYMKVTWNQYKFTLHNLKAEDIGGLFQCEFSLSSAVTMKPIQTVTGKHATKLLPGLAGDAPVLVCPSPLPESPEAEPIDQLKWIVIGLSVFLCFYSFTITFFYSRLRVLRSEELYDSLTYVPMQPNQTQPTTGRGNINSTYMDMRKVPVGVRGSRSINHNSRLIV
uniref:uncharacterized protein si:ch211-67e16.3 n=1 Tax=Oncorhynchus gorbuscha TaxID=8017 RepID=UPI001EAEA513|nr:uncharacterized protein si:ch211-67e16.3 [Oncorhynchus gorbuscha]